MKKINILSLFVFLLLNLMLSCSKKGDAPQSGPAGHDHPFTATINGANWIANSVKTDTWSSTTHIRYMAIRGENYTDSFMFFFQMKCSISPGTYYTDSSTTISCGFSNYGAPMQVPDFYFHPGIVTILSNNGKTIEGNFSGTITDTYYKKTLQVKDGYFIADY